MLIVLLKSAPPIKQPTIAPKNNEYTGLNFFRIRNIATNSPIRAPYQLSRSSLVIPQDVLSFIYVFYKSNIHQYIGALIVRD